MPILKELLANMTPTQLEELIELAKKELVSRLFKKKEEDPILVFEDEEEEEEEETNEEEEEDEEEEGKKPRRATYMWDTKSKAKAQRLTIRIVPEYVDELRKKLDFDFKIKNEKPDDNLLREFKDTWTFSEYKNSSRPIASFPLTQFDINCKEAREKLSKELGQKISDKTKSVWYPERPKKAKDQVANPDIKDTPGLLNPQYPVYVISKGRWEKRLTCDALEKMGVPYRLVVETQEVEKYAKYVDKSKILTLPTTLPFNGSGIPARNWVWEHAKSEGHKYHWILDDNLDGFTRFNRNVRDKVKSGYIFRHIEQMVERHNNVMMAGMNYSMFIPEISMRRPLITKNTRIYSCILLKNDIPNLDERWRGKYNEDTDLSLRILKLGHSTFLFNNYLCNKKTTLTMKGGNAEIYSGSGVQEKLDSLIRQHPDVVKGTIKYNRPHHQVNYKPYADNPSTV